MTDSTFKSRRLLFEVHGGLVGGVFALEDFADATLEFLLPCADLRRRDVIIFGDLLNRLLIFHRLSGDAGFEFGT
ncbi:hypothetical protein OAE58_01405 [Akkermansiaceae bacterium]|nr:hypothetical protein [Akkermansiaceae bacterium]MDB4309665.1 hypothetical protein [Akkermansiaceae bacterium]MDB4321259.1 hypothetical protein [Akkermansiaceae bacterium]MDB4414222.1 hypothetical protein [Akkermansiaceae bacterium]MDB4639692.1 hypothetical protein [Akkermansiaceae bacterium]